MTEQKQIKESEMRFRSMLEHLPVAICVMKGENYVVEVANEKQLELFGKTKEQVLNLPIFTVMPEGTIQGFEELLSAVFKTGKPFITNERPVTLIRNSKEVLIYLNLHYKPLYNDEHKINGIISVATDVTEQVISRKKIEESEAFSRSVLESSPDCVKVIDAEGQLQFMNVNGLCTMEIDDFSAFKNKPWSELWGEDNKHLINGAIDKALAGNTASFQAFCPTAKGTPKWWDVMVSPVVSPGSNHINSLISVSRDVTEQVNSQKKIEESETLHRQIFEFSPVAIWEKDDTALYQEIELLKQKGIKDFRKYLDKNPAEIFRLVSLVKLEDVNNESVNLLEAASKQEVITSFHKLFTEESIPVLKEGIIGVAENKKRLTITSVLQGLKGKRLDILFSFDFRIGHDLNKSLVSLTDITEQVEARKKIEANEIQFRKTSEYLEIATSAAEVGIWSLDLSSQKLDWSPLHKKLWGYDDQRSDLVYEDWHIVILTEDKEAAFAEIAKALKTKTLYEAVYRIRRNNDAEVRWMKSSGQYFYNEKDEPVMLTGVSIDITDEKIAEENLLASEERFRLATKASGVGIWEWNVITNKIWWDAQMFSIYGIAPTADGFIEYSTWSNAVAPDDLSVQEKILQDTVKYVGTSNRSFKIYRANDGMLRFIDAIETVRTNAAGQAEWVMGTNLDVTEQKKLMAKLNTTVDNLRLYEKVVINTNDAVLITEAEPFDLPGPKILYVNDAFCNMSGYTKEEVIGKSPRILQGPKTDRKQLDKIRSALSKWESVKVELINYTKDGREFYVEFEIVPLANEEGWFTHWVSVQTDVTERKMAELQIQEREERFRSLAETLPQMVWVMNGDGEMEYGSTNWKEYSGIEDVREAWNYMMHPDDIEQLTAYWRQVFAAKEGFKHEMQLKNKEGIYRWFYSVGEPLFDADEKVIKWVGSLTDIQEQKIREEKKDEFISIASHEMKTPLTTAKAYLQMLELSLDENDEDSNLFAKKASQSVNRLNELVSELLDVSKIRLGKLNYTITTFNFNEMIESTVENVQLTSQTHNIIKTGKVFDNVTGDKDRLQQVVINLLNNAIKYSPGAEKVFINVEQEKEVIKISVIDYGIGMSNHSLNKIFEKYHRIEEHAVHFQGLGIGLFISYEIIERHNGKLWAESETGKGSTFYFTIPLDITSPQ